MNCKTFYYIGVFIFLTFMGISPSAHAWDDDEDGFFDINDGGDDCNDEDPTVNPGAPEICIDGIDNNCDGATDDCPEVIDDDQDGFSENGGDCDDTNPLIHPDAPEVCDDTIDNNCNDSVDEDCDGDDNDVDNDGDGLTENQGDCDDTNPNINPQATEICEDNVDNDCDDQVDEDCNGNAVDDDGDGFTENQGDCDDTNASTNPDATEICGDDIDNDCSGGDEDCPVNGDDVDDDGDGFTENQGDCDDTNPSVNPDAVEIIDDGIDNDCDDQIDECHHNGDGDPLAHDDDGDGLSENDGDCNDANPAISPNEHEIMDNLDNDCNGIIDDGCVGNHDDDNDGDGVTEEDGDCDDSDAAINPDATERCDETDNDCDGKVDENFFDPDTGVICLPEIDGDVDLDDDSDGFTDIDGDCDDLNADVNPNATEVCDDGLDNDCNGGVDESDCTTTQELNANDAETPPSSGSPAMGGCSISATSSKVGSSALLLLALTGTLLSLRTKLRRPL